MREAGEIFPAISTMAVAIMEVTWCSSGCFWFGLSLPAESALNCTSGQAEGLEAFGK